MKKRWREFDPTWPRSCEDAAGVYVLMHGLRVMYVGQSESVYRRIRNYRFENYAGTGDAREFHDGHTATPWGNWRWADGAVVGKVCYANRYGEHLMIEARMIRRLQPIHNLRGLGNGR